MNNITKIAFITILSLFLLGCSQETQSKATIVPQSFTVLSQSMASESAELAYIHHLTFTQSGVSPSSVTLYAGAENILVIDSKVNCAFYVKELDFSILLKRDQLNQITWSPEQTGTFDYACQGLRNSVGQTGTVHIR